MDLLRVGQALIESGLEASLCSCQRRAFYQSFIASDILPPEFTLDMMMPDLVKQIANRLRAAEKHLSTAESCTGGLIAKLCTDLAGSSDWFERGFVTYSNEAKHDLLAVSMSLIDSYGAVSEPVAVAMVRGALEHSLADYAIAVTGVAGPGGGSEDKPVGTVWIAVAGPQQYLATCYQFGGDRQQVREATAEQALSDLLAIL